MRNLVYLIVIAIFMASCSKDKFAEQQPTNNQGEIKLVTLTDGSKTSVTLLEFSSVEHYEATITSLETQMEQHEDAFLAAWSSLSDDALNAKEDEIGFVDHQPLIDFENEYNIPSTLRQVFVAAEQQWLNNVDLVVENSPSLTYPFGMAELTLLNTDGMVKIGDNIIQLTKRGFVQIANLDIATVIRIKNGDMSALQEPSVTTSIEDGGGKGECTNWKGKDYPHEYVSGSRKVIKHVHFHSYPWKGVGSAEITSYKKQGSSWKKYKMDLGVAVQTDFRDNNCSNTLMMWSGWKYKKAKSIEKNNASWGAFPQYRAEKNLSVFGQFNYAGNSNMNYLTW